MLSMSEPFETSLNSAQVHPLLFENKDKHHRSVGREKAPMPLTKSRNEFTEPVNFIRVLLAI
jgi:hypothetical protein